MSRVYADNDSHCGHSLSIPFSFPFIAMGKPPSPSSFWLTAALALLVAFTSMIMASPTDTLLHASATSGDSNAAGSADAVSLVLQPMFWVKIVIIILLVAGSGIVAGEYYDIIKAKIPEIQFFVNHENLRGFKTFEVRSDGQK